MFSHKILVSSQNPLVFCFRVLGDKGQRPGLDNYDDDESFFLSSALL